MQVISAKLIIESFSILQCYIAGFTDENVVDRIKEMMRQNYDRIKAEAKQIVADELQRIKDDPELAHLLQQQE